MLPTAHLPVGISTHNCLSWSSDGELAIAAGEEIYLLLPRYAIGEPWTHVHFRVNTFTYDEWPSRAQASFADMAIGEEQARVTVTGIAWSPPGLAKYRRSVLAILTSNLLLSIWAPGSNPTNENGWERVLIINDTAIPQAIAPSSAIRSLRRVRSMAWAPPHPHHVGGHEILSSMGKRETPLLAVADEINGLCFLKVFGPFRSASLAWDVQILTYNTLEPVEKVNYRPSLLRDVMNTKHFINYIAFDEWNTSSGIGRGISVTYRSSGVFYQSTLALETSDGLKLIDTQINQLTAKRKHDLPQTAPPLMQAILQGQKAKYATENNLSIDGVVLKTWGVASLGDLVAVCLTSHPRNMVEYQAYSEMYTTVLFGDSAVENQEKDFFPWQEVPEVDERKARQTIITTSLDDSLPTELTPFDLKIRYATSQSVSSPTTPELPPPDKCPFCGDDVGIEGASEGSKELYCPNGHPFGMSLSSLPRTR